VSEEITKSVTRCKCSKCGEIIGTIREAKISPPEMPFNDFRPADNCRIISVYAWESGTTLTVGCTCTEWNVIRLDHPGGELNENKQ
jgi:hypothetical protein